MRLQLVSVCNFIVPCKQCGEFIRQGSPRWADLDGEAFKAYYCAPCYALLDLHGLDNHDKKDNPA